MLSLVHIIRSNWIDIAASYAFYTIRLRYCVYTPSIFKWDVSMIQKAWQFQVFTSLLSWMKNQLSYSIIDLRPNHWLYSSLKAISARPSDWFSPKSCLWFSMNHSKLTHFSCNRNEMSVSLEIFWNLCKTSETNEVHLLSQQNVSDVVYISAKLCVYRRQFAKYALLALQWFRLICHMTNMNCVQIVKQMQPAKI